MTLRELFTDIANAIRSVKGTTEPIKAENFSSEIETISSGGSGKYAPRYLYQVSSIYPPISFRDYTGTELDYETSMLDTTCFPTMQDMFNNCSNLISLDISDWNTSNVTNMGGMFRSCGKLTKLDLSGFDTSNVTDMSSMFYYCSSLVELNLSSFDTRKVTDMGMMFRYCRELEKLDIRNFTFDSVTSYTSIFQFMPASCLIIVKDDTAKAWVLARRSDFTNVKTVAELEV